MTQTKLLNRACHPVKQEGITHKVRAICKLILHHKEWTAAKFERWFLLVENRGWCQFLCICYYLWKSKPSLKNLPVYHMSYLFWPKTKVWNFKIAVSIISVWKSTINCQRLKRTNKSYLCTQIRNIRRDFSIWAHFYDKCA